MFWRAVLAFAAMPALVAYAVPAGWLWHANRLTIAWPAGLAMLAIGTVGLLWCVRDFYVRGRGTLAPWAPPRRLVVVGLYRYSRNPMYVSVALVLLGWALAFASVGVFVYALCVMLAFWLRVVHGEEPWLAATHGEQWRDYVKTVHRWFGRRAGPSNGPAGGPTD